MKTNCHICNSDNWLPLPDPVDLKSVTTTGKIVSEPLAKSICLECGLVQRARAPFLGATTYYEEEYANYYERPGTEQFHQKRYEQIVKWMSRHLSPDFHFTTVLDVGCGQGWAMDAMLSTFPGITIHGIEPSKHNSSIARKRGHNLLEGKLENLNIKTKYDLIYTNNVIQHVNNPRDFIFNLMKLLGDNGVIIITCPDGSKPHIELLFSDHNYSFLPANLIALATELGFANPLWSRSDENPSLPPAQLLLLTNNRQYLKNPPSNSDHLARDLKGTIAGKLDYLSSLKQLSAFLEDHILRYAHVYNFGASFWTSVLAAYCPAYWSKVEACLVDTKDNATDFMGKPIYTFDEVKEKKDSLVVLGTSPGTHAFLSDKLGTSDTILRWDTFFKY